MSSKLREQRHQETPSSSQSSLISSEFLTSVFIVALSWATLAAYEVLDRDHATQRFLAREKKHCIRFRVLEALMIGCIVLLTAAGAFSARYVIDTCAKRAFFSKS